MPKNRSAPTTSYLEEHSEAKASFISAYLSVYHRILERAQSIREVLIYDLMCGEGVYADGKKGTAHEVLDAVKRHFFSDLKARQGQGMRVGVHLNDTGVSDITDGMSKAQHAAESCGALIRTLRDNTHYQVEVTETDALDLALASLKKIGAGRSRRFLLIFDPRGYSRVTPSSLREILSFEGVEIFLFVPVSNMYRPAKAAQKQSFPGSRPIEIWIEELWGDEPVMAQSATEFLEQLRNRVTAMLGVGHYVGSFQLDSSSSANSYGLLFISQTLRGLEVINEKKWSHDPEKGAGYRRDRSQFSIFNPSRDRFNTELVEFIRSSPSGRSNLEIAEFAITRGFLAKHAKEALDPLLRARSIVRVDDQGRPAPGYHLNRPSRDKTKRFVKMVQPSLL